MVIWNFHLSNVPSEVEVNVGILKDMLMLIHSEP